MVESLNHTLQTPTHIKENLGHREGCDLAPWCQRGGIAASNPQESQWGCSSSCLWSSAAAAQESGHKDDGSKSKEGLLSNMGISVQNKPEKWYTPWELSAAARPSATRLLPKEGGFSELQKRGAEDSSPCLVIAVRQPAFPMASPARRRGTLPITRAFSVRGHALLLEKECGQRAHHRAQFPRGAPRETSGRNGENFTGLTGYTDKFGQNYWCTRSREQLHPQTPAPQAPCRAKSMRNSFWVNPAALGLELCVHTHTYFFILMPRGSRATCAFSFKVSKVNQILAGKL